MNSSCIVAKSIDQVTIYKLAPFRIPAKHTPGTVSGMNRPQYPKPAPKHAHGHEIDGEMEKAPRSLCGTTSTAATKLHGGRTQPDRSRARMVSFPHSLLAGTFPPQAKPYRIRHNGEVLKTNRRSCTGAQFSPSPSIRLRQASAREGGRRRQGTVWNRPGSVDLGVTSVSQLR